MKAVFILLITALGLQAQFSFPSPPHVIYGYVRNMTGGVIDNEEIEIVVLADGVEVGSAVVVPHETRSENYRIEIPTTTGEPDRRYYTVRVREDSQLSSITPDPSRVFSFNPIPGGLTVFNFVQGNDLDGDDLPDDLEELQLAALGLTDIADFRPDDDLDFDGLTNCQELIAGTIASDFDSQLNFKVAEIVADDWVEILFDVVTNRIYAVEVSTDGNSWELVDVAPGDLRSNLTRSYVATGSQRLTVTTPPVAGDSVFYRISVR